MKKILYVVGIGALVGSAYWYFKKQLELALQYEYDIKKWKILDLNDQEVKVEIVISLTNKSSFEIEVLGYDLSLFYQNVNIARAFSTEKTKITAQSVIDVKTTATIRFDDLKSAFLPFATAILKKKPINLNVDGYVNVKFINLNHTINFNKDKFEYSSDLLADYGLNDDWDKLKEKYKFLNKI